MEKEDIICPNCNSNKVVPIFYGVPGTGPSEKEKAKEPEHLDFIYSPDNPQWHCNNCGYEW